MVIDSVFNLFFQPPLRRRTAPLPRRGRHRVPPRPKMVQGITLIIPALPGSE